MTTPTAQDRRARRAVLVGFAIQGLTFASIVTRLVTFKDKFDLSDYQILLLLAAVAFSSAVGSLIAGYTAERWGSARTLRWGLVGVSVGVALPGLAGSLAALIAATCVFGLFVGAVDASLNMQGVGVQDRYGRSIMTGFHAMWSAAAVVGAIYASLTIELDWTVALALLFVALIGLALNAWSTRGLLRHDPLDAPADPAAQERRPHHVPWLPLLLIALPTTAMWLGDSASAVWSGIYLEDGLGTAASTAPIAYGAYQLVLLVVRLVGDRLVRRHGPEKVVRVSGIVATVALILIVAAPSIPVVIAGFALLGGGLALIPPLSFVAAAHLDVEGGSNAVARVNLANYVGYIVAAFGIAIVAEAGSNRLMFLVPLAVIPLLPLMARQFAPRVRPTSSSIDPHNPTRSTS